MKITIDTKAKTIKIEEENVLLKDLFSFLKEMDVDLKEYSLVPFEKKIEYVPYYVEKYIPTITYPSYPYEPSWPLNPTWTITCGGEFSTGTISIGDTKFDYTLIH